MGNPVSTRLGVNQFWYKHWYSDSSRALELRQDESLETLISFYLQYGITFQTNPFIHEYWYRKNMKNIRIVVQSKLNSRFFRRYFYTNDTLSIEHSYLIRNKTPEFFPMRTWIMKYAGWVIFSVQWFKPLKIKPKFISWCRTASYSGGVAMSSAHPRLSRRLKLVILYLLKFKATQYVF